MIDYWKSLIILKEIKKPSGTFLRIWAKNQLWGEIFWETFKIYIRKSQLIIDIQLIFYPNLQDLCHFIQLSKITPFFGLGGCSPSPCGRHRLQFYTIAWNKETSVFKLLNIRTNMKEIRAFNIFVWSRNTWKASSPNAFQF